MVRRSTPQKKIDDRAFPVRMLIYVPEQGFGRRLDLIFQWLNQHLGRENYAHHSNRAIGLRDMTGFYFRHPDAASRFLTAFPDLELADGTVLETYRSPSLPFGRRRG